MADIPAVLVVATAGGLVFLLVLWAAVAIAVFVHATRDENRYAIPWGIATLVFPIFFAVLYVARVWWRRGGKENFRPR